MPELPEVETVVRELNRKLKNQTIKNVEVRLAKIVALGPGTLPPKRQSKVHQARKFVKLLQGRTIRSVARRAKLLVFDFYRKPSTIATLAPSVHSNSNHLHTVAYDSEERWVESGREFSGIQIDGSLALLVHLKMTGQFIYFKKSELNKKVRIINNAAAPLHRMPTKYTHVVITFADGSRLFYNDLRQFGYLKLVKDVELKHVRELTQFGPEPLAKGFSLLRFFTAVKKRSKASVKTALMDQTLIAGIGNIYSDEILFRAKVAPARSVKNLKPYQLKAIYRAITFILKKGIAAHGSSVGDFIRTDGSWGSMGRYHFVYSRAGKSCKVCGAIIKSAKFNGRTGSYCPACQK